MQDGESGDLLLQCILCSPDKRLGHGCFRSILHTDGLPRQVELYPNGEMKTKKEDARYGKLHFNCECNEPFGVNPPINKALQQLRNLAYGLPPIAEKSQSATEIINLSNAAMAADSIAATIQRGGRIRKLSSKAQAIFEEQQKKEKAKTDKKEQKKEEEMMTRGCWQYNATETSPCTKAIYNNQVLGGLCKHHARCAVAELASFIKSQEYTHYADGNSSKLNFLMVDVEYYLSEEIPSIGRTRTLYKQLLHELRFDFLRATNRLNN